MKIYRSFQELGGHPHPRLVMALGNFDGVHMGHRELIRETVDMAHELAGVPGIFTFYPHPLKVLNPEQAPPMLLPVEEKINLMGQLGAEVMLLATFNRDFAALPPKEFVQQVLCQSLQVAGVVIGYNYSFGCGGTGTPELLTGLGKEYGFSVKVVSPVEVAGEVVSSTLIRELLLQGEVKKAATFLGYCPFLKGKVVHGEKRGRQLGFPTANLDLPEDILVPANGVYAVEVVMGEERFSGVANIGVKPTFHRDSRRRNVEVFVFDFQRDIYDREIEVIFLERIRGEKAFNSSDELLNQIKADIEKARSILNQLQLGIRSWHIQEAR